MIKFDWATFDLRDYYFIDNVKSFVVATSIQPDYYILPVITDYIKSRAVK